MARVLGPVKSRQKKSGPIGPDDESRLIMQRVCGESNLVRPRAPARSSRTDAAGSVFSIDPLPIVMPISRTVMVPPANSANSESCRPQSAPAMPRPNSATIEPTCPRDDQRVDRGISRFRQRPMMPQTWNKMTRTLEDGHKSRDGTPTTIQAPSLVPAWDIGDGSQIRDPCGDSSWLQRSGPVIPPGRISRTNRPDGEEKPADPGRSKSKT